mmetsp:Transcript_109383/g.235598  ORF Transcript_109383/g.235598 Transcript_109383/m.235598 type:complete len:203 (-) Transcript_109383:398-1006(-)
MPEGRLAVTQARPGHPASPRAAGPPRRRLRTARPRHCYPEAEAPEGGGPRATAAFRPSRRPPRMRIRRTRRSASGTYGSSRQAPQAGWSSTWRARSRSRTFCFEAAVPATGRSWSWPSPSTARRPRPASRLGTSCPRSTGGRTSRACQPTWCTRASTPRSRSSSWASSASCRLRFASTTSRRAVACRRASRSRSAAAPSAWS